MSGFLDRDLQFRTLTNAFEKEEIYRLRHKVFAEELAWVPCREDEKEIDDYDKSCVLVGLYAKNNLIACLRIHLPFQKFMMDKEFKEIIGDYKVKKTENTIEVTRFCIDPALRRSSVVTRYGKFPIIMALEKAFYNWCRFNGMDNVYMVVSNKFFRLLNLLGMPCAALSPAVKMPDGVIALGAISSWTAFEEYNEVNSPNLLAWFKDCDFGEFEEEVAA